MWIKLIASMLLATIMTTAVVVGVQSGERSRGATYIGVLSFADLDTSVGHS